MAARPKQPASKETHETIKEQTAAFLKAGGKVQQVATGVTGQQNVSGYRQTNQGKSAPKGSD